MIFLGDPVTEASDFGVCLILPVAILLYTWYRILCNHSKHPIPCKVMAVLIVCTVFILAMLPLGLLSFAFWVSIVILVFPFGFGVSALLNRLLYQRCSSYTEGTITDIRHVKIKSQYSVSSTYYYPIITFYVDGVQYNEESSFPCDPDEVGNTCWVRYNPNDPHEITQEQYEKGIDKLLFVLSMILLCVALIFIIIGISDIVYLLRQ